MVQHKAIFYCLCIEFVWLKVYLKFSSFYLVLTYILILCKQKDQLFLKNHCCPDKILDSLQSIQN